MASRFGISCNITKYVNSDYVSVHFSNPNAKSNCISAGVTIDPNDYPDAGNTEDIADIAKVLYETASKVL